MKVDFLAVDEKGRRTIEKFIKQYPHIKMLAEKIETEEQFQSAKESGYNLFQGYFFAEPEIIRGVDIPANLSLHLQIISKLNDSEPDIDEIANLILHDISATYKLLRFINTMHFEVPKSIGSVKQAIVLIGLRELRKWMQILMLHEISDHTSNGRIKALVSYSMTRAKMCELAAFRAGYPNGDEHFFVGLFSLLDVIMQRDLGRNPADVPVLSGSGGDIARGADRHDAILRARHRNGAIRNGQNRRLRQTVLALSKEEIFGLSNKANKWARMLES